MNEQAAPSLQVVYLSSNHPTPYKPDSDIIACNTKVSLWEPEPTVSIAGMGVGEQGTCDAVEGLCDLEGGRIWHLCNVFPTHNVSSL